MKKNNIKKFQSIIKNKYDNVLSTQEAQQLWDRLVDYLDWEIQFRGFYGFEGHKNYTEMLKANLQRLDWDYRIEYTRLKKYTHSAYVQKKLKLMEFFKAKSNDELFVECSKIFYEVSGEEINDRTKKEIEKIENQKMKNEEF